MSKKLVAVLIIAAVVASEFSVFGTGFVGSAYALGTPQIVSINPSSPAPVGTNVSIRATTQWDNDFRSMRICFRDESWCQEDATPDITKNFDTSGLSAGTYTIIAEVAAKDQGWDTANKTYASYELTAPAQPTQPPQPPSPPQGPSISEVSFNPSGGAQVGQKVTIHIRVDSSNPGAIRVTQPCGSLSHVETTVPEFDDIWNTSGCGAGNLKVQVCARDVNDPNWANATCTNRTYSLSNPPAEAPTADFWSDAASIQAGQCTMLHWSTGNATAVDIDGNGVNTSGSMQVCPAITKHYSLSAKGPGGTASRSLTVEVYAASVPTTVVDPTSSFSTGDIIKIGLDVYVVISGQRRHVPNPETLDALGISQNEVNNKGFSDSQLSMIPKGSDIPDVVRDPSGFATFKATFFPNRVPIKPNTGSSPTQAPATGGNGSSVIPTSVPSPTPVQVQQPGQVGQEQGGLVACGTMPGNDPSWPVKSVGAATWCTDFVYSLRPDIVKCWKGSYPDAADWDDWARDQKISAGCGLKVNASAAGQAPDINDIWPMDVVVWEKDCGGADSVSGHVAYVTGVDRGKRQIDVKESNWARSGYGVKIENCMSFIHVGSQAVSPPSPSAFGETTGLFARAAQVISDLWNSVLGFLGFK